MNLKRSIDVLKNKLLVSYPILLILTFCPPLIFPAYAQKGCDCNFVSPTDAGNREYTPDWRDPYKLQIYASDDEIDPGGSIILHIVSNSYAFPPFSWSVSGTGYSLNKTTTYSVLEELDLTCRTGT